MCQNFIPQIVQELNVSLIKWEKVASRCLVIFTFLSYLEACIQYVFEKKGNSVCLFLRSKFSNALQKNLIKDKI